jgi:ADP-heptose:LPS heptosyltransferase
MERRTVDGWLEAQPPGRIAVVRALQLGDLLCAIPMLRALRVTWPQAKVTLVGLPWSSALVRRFDHYIDDMVEFPGWPDIPERGPDPIRLIEFRERARAARFDLAVQAHGNGRHMNVFLDELHARRRAGFHPAGEPSPGPGFIPYPTDRHESLRLLALAAHLGARELSTALEFPLGAEDHREALQLREELGLLGRPYACLHPGSSAATRRWCADGFARVADELTGLGLEVVLTGTRDEADLASAVRRSAHRPLRSAVGRTSLEGVAALIADARLLVSNDTGVSHLAAALGVPSVVVFSGSDPRRWAPLPKGRHVAVGRGIPDERDGSPPTRGSTAEAGHAIHLDVIRAVRRQLAVPRGMAA